MKNSIFASKNRFLIPSIKVDAPLSIKTVNRDGIMPEPDIPDDIVYYDFTNWPMLGGIIGKEGNAIFTGHVDSGIQACKYGTVPPPCKAVLWDLDKVAVGNKITICYEGEKYHYRVFSNTQVALEGDHWKKIISKTKEETITIVTCGGEFDTSIYGYKSRQIVRAKRTFK